MLCQSNYCLRFHLQYNMIILKYFRRKLINHSSRFVPCNSLLIHNNQNFSSQKCEINEKQYSEFRVEHYDAGQRLDRYLKSTKIGWVSAQKYLRNKDIIIKDKYGQFQHNNAYRMQENDKILIKKNKEIENLLTKDKNLRMVDLQESKVEQILQSMIIFDNKNITVFNKFGNYSVQGGSDHTKNLFSLMCSRFKKQMIYINHRLDKPTTGLVMISKNYQTAQLIGKMIQNRQKISKYYLGITEGSKIENHHGYIECNIEWTSKHKARISKALAKDASTEQSLTYYLKIKQTKINDIRWRNILGMKLISGKKHQLRCHLSNYLLNPIINDSLYLGNKLANVQNLNDEIYLHSFYLQISDPEVISKVFEVNSSKEIYLADNHKGRIELKNGVISAFASLPQSWKYFEKDISNQALSHLASKIEKEQFKIRQTKIWKKKVIKIE